MNMIWRRRMWMKMPWIRGNWKWTSKSTWHRRQWWREVTTSNWFGHDDSGDSDNNGYGYGDNNDMQFFLKSSDKHERKTVTTGKTLFYDIIFTTVIEKRLSTYNDGNCVNIANISKAVSQNRLWMRAILIFNPTRLFNIVATTPMLLPLVQPQPPVSISPTLPIPTQTQTLSLDPPPQTTIPQTLSPPPTYSDIPSPSNHLPQSHLQTHVFANDKRGRSLWKKFFM